MLKPLCRFINIKRNKVYTQTCTFFCSRLKIIKLISRVTGMNSTTTNNEDLILTGPFQEIKISDTTASTATTKRVRRRAKRNHPAKPRSHSENRSQILPAASDNCIYNSSGDLRLFTCGTNFSSHSEKKRARRKNRNPSQRPIPEPLSNGNGSTRKRRSHSCEPAVFKKPKKGIQNSVLSQGRDKISDIPSFVIDPENKEEKDFLENFRFDLEQKNLSQCYQFDIC